MIDSDLIAKLKNRDPAAFNYLLTAHGSMVLNTCYKFLINKQDAEDLSQEVFIEVFQSIHDFRNESKLSTWIYRIAVTKSLDELRKRNRKKRLISVGKMLHLDNLVNWISGGSMPDEKILENEQMSEIQCILDTLSENQRIAYTLSRIEGCSNGEIAEIMNTSTGAIETLIYRAKNKVQDEIRKVLKINT